MVPLHAHSFYSLLEGGASVSQLLEKARGYGLKALALTDTNGMYGLIDFAKQARQAQIKPLFGAYIDEEENKDMYAVFLARNIKGYEELCKIITTKKLKKEFSLEKLLAAEFPNLFIITGSAELLMKIPPRPNIFAELIAVKNKKAATRRLYEIAKERGARFIASNPVYFAGQDDFILHKTLTAIRLRGTIANLAPADLADEEYYFKDPAALKELWRGLPEALSGIEHIVDNCNVDLGIGKYKFPVFKTGEDNDSFSFLWGLCFDGLSRRYTKITDDIRKRLEYELGVIDDLGLADYFLVVWDIVREAKRRAMMMIGRGSAANSLVSYCLGFTEVDPIRYKFYFERFLNRSRSSPPDVDLDFSWRERDEIIKYVFEKYGYDKVAMISTHVTFRGRSAFREAAKAFGVSEAEVSKISKFIPWMANARNLPNIAKLYPEAKSLKLDGEPWKSIVDVAARLADFPRHISIHPSGLVISPKPITNYTALEYAKNKGLGLIVTQPNMHGIEDMGLIKIDLLSQRALGVLRDTIKRLDKVPPGFAKQAPAGIFTLAPGRK
jgi:DNA polymerase III alpha subunit